MQCEIDMLLSILLKQNFVINKKDFFLKGICWIVFCQYRFIVTMFGRNNIQFFKKNCFNRTARRFDFDK